MQKEENSRDEEFDQNARAAAAFSRKFTFRNSFQDIKQPRISQISQKMSKSTSNPEVMTRSQSYSAFKLPKNTEDERDGEVDPQDGLNLTKVINHFKNVQSNPKSPSHHTAPQRFTFYSEQAGVIRSSSFSNFDISIPDVPITKMLSNSSFWIDVAAPTHLEMAEISQVFNLHPLTTEDILTPDTREKCEVFSRYYFVVIRSFEQDQYKPSFLSPITGKNIS